MKVEDAVQSVEHITGGLSGIVAAVCFYICVHAVEHGIFKLPFALLHKREVHEAYHRK